MRNIKETFTLIIVWLFRVPVALLFIVSGLIKVNDLTGFAYKLTEYFEVFHVDFGFPAEPFIDLALPIAAFIAIFETLLGFTLLIGIMQRFTTLMLLLMIIFFTLLTGYSAIFDKVTDCGCFGDALKLTPLQSFIKDLVLLVLISFLFIFTDHIKPVFGWIVNIVLFALATVFLSFMAWHTTNYLPWIDFRAAKVGSDLRKNTTTPRPGENNPPLKDYFSVQLDCGKDEFAGKTVLVVAYKPMEVTSAEWAHIKQLHTDLKARGTALYLLSTGSVETKTIVKQYGLDSVCTSLQDMTMLKTMIRSNPGYVLLNNGIVKAQYHTNSAPDAAEVEARLK